MQASTKLSAVSLTFFALIDWRETPPLPLEILEHMPHLQFLRLRGMPLAKLTSLRRLYGLTSLNLASNGLDSLPQLPQSSSLISVTVENQSPRFQLFHPDDVVNLEALPQLQKISLIQDADMIFIRAWSEESLAVIQDIQDQANFLNRQLNINMY